MPNSVLLIGNGFSIDYVDYILPDSQIDLRQLAPPPSWVDQKVGCIAGTDREAPLWSGDRYPMLFKSWDAYQKAEPSASFHDYCSFLASERAYASSSGEVAASSLSVFGGSSRLQLRQYLWRLFCAYDERARDHMRVELTHFLEWRYSWLINQLLNQGSLLVISYNYDVFLEHTLASLGANFVVPTSNFARYVELPNSRRVCIFKPHGSISIANQGIAGCEGDANWFVGSCDVSGATHVRYPPGKSLPALPGVVPPGHDLDHEAYFGQQMQRAIHDAIGSSDLFVTVGFSASGADEKEFRSLCNAIHARQRVVAVGVSEFGDQENSCAVILRGAAASVDANYDWIDANELSWEGCSTA